MYSPNSALPVRNRAKEKVSGSEPEAETKLASVKRFLKRNLLYCNYVSLILVITIGIYGWVYLFIYIPLYAGFLLWLHWEQYIFGLEVIETRLWGRPLSHYMESGKPRPKLKFVWRKDRGNN